MELHKFRIWTESEIKALRKEFARIEFKGSHNPNHYRIKKALEKRGINRSEKAVSRKLNKLGLVYFKVNDNETLGKCEDCKKPIVLKIRYLNRENKQKRCAECQEKHRHDWDKLHKEESKIYHSKYSKNWYKIHNRRKLKGGNN